MAEEQKYTIMMTLFGVGATMNVAPYGRELQISNPLPIVSEQRAWDLRNCVSHTHPRIRIGLLVSFLSPMFGPATKPAVHADATSISSRSIPDSGVLPVWDAL